jgi:hypothetical protein
VCSSGAIDNTVYSIASPPYWESLLFRFICESLLCSLIQYAGL